MAKQERFENQEVKHEQGAVKSIPEKQEQKFDSEYLHSITRYFDDRREEFKDDPIMLDYLTQCRDNLAKLRDPKVAEKVQPKEICFALAQALQEIPPVLFPGSGELENLEHFEKRYLESRKIFMDTCKKIFPEVEVEVDPSSINRNMRKTHRVNPSTLTNVEDDQHITNITMAVSEIQKDLKADPQKLVQEIDNLMHEYHSTIGSNYMGKLKDHYETGEGKFELPEEEKINSAVIVENLYKLQLVKDELMKRIYGRADVTPIEKRKIDEAKSELK